MQRSGSIKEAILDQAEQEAQKILLEARRKADQILKNAEEERNAKLEEIRRKTVEEANRESERIRTKANVEAKRATIERKMMLLAKITEEARKMLKERKTSYAVEEFIKTSLTDGLPMFSKDAKLHMYVNSKDLSSAKKALRDLNLSASIAIEPNDNILGGVIIESWDHRVRFDNNYESRLNSYIEKHLSQIAKALFES
jgi:vacuolar-type H+-ATPase subunit E/Vma4